MNLDFNSNECSSVQLLVQFDNETLSVRLSKSDNTNGIYALPNTNARTQLHQTKDAKTTLLFDIQYLL